MATPAEIRNLLKTIRGIAPALNKEEIAEIGRVCLKALERIEKESEES